MKSTCVKAITLAAIALILFTLVGPSGAQESTQDSTISFQLLNEPDGDETYQLNVTVPQSLYEYYVGRKHGLSTPDDFPKFVTPYALKPIADRLWQIYDNSEDFTNGVLMLVHQINYTETIPGKYPVETLVAANGDCDLFVFIAASILEAGGINTVLLYYKDQLHMEIGVQLPEEPADARTQVYSVEYQNISYYIGECTGKKWREGWRIGECPTDYTNATAQVVTLEGMEQTSIGQVSANLKELDPSTVTLQVSSSFTLETVGVTIKGQILPQATTENVTLQAKINSPTWTTIGTVETQEDGLFEYMWTPQTGGSITLQASWTGNKEFNGAKSEEATVFVLPLLVIAVVASSVLTVCLVTFTFVKIRSREPQLTVPVPDSPQETPPTDPEPPNPPSPPLNSPNAEENMSDGESTREQPDTDETKKA